MKYLILLVLSTLLLFSCQPSLNAEFVDSPVVESYLHANRTPYVQIRRLIPLRSDVTYSTDHPDSLSLTLEDLTSGINMDMVGIGNGGYTHPQVLVREHAYRLRFMYNGVEVSAETTVPPTPIQMRLSSSQLQIPVFGPGPMASTRASEGMSLLEIYWKNPERNTYLVVIECLEANPTYIRDTTYGISPSTRFKTEPTQDSICVLSPQSFTYLGRHRIILFRLQPEYLLLLKSNSNQSQSLQEIRANITNGFGIFSAMDSDTLSLNVVRYLF